MTAVVIALLPAAGFGIYNFGPRALAVMAVTIASTVLTELLFGWLWKKKITISDMSAVVTGLLLALNLPVSIPLWMAALGGVFAILVVKMLFGGLGQNFMNPALAARCFLLISFPSQMTNFACDAYTLCYTAENTKVPGNLLMSKKLFPQKSGKRYDGFLCGNRLVSKNIVLSCIW